MSKLMLFVALTNIVVGDGDQLGVLHVEVDDWRGGEVEQLVATVLDVAPLYLYGRV